VIKRKEAQKGSVKKERKGHGENRLTQPGANHLGFGWGGDKKSPLKAGVQNAVRARAGKRKNCRGSGQRRKNILTQVAKPLKEDKGTKRKGEEESKYVEKIKHFAEKGEGGC